MILFLLNRVLHGLFPRGLRIAVRRDVVNDRLRDDTRLFRLRVFRHDVGVKRVANFGIDQRHVEVRHVDWLLHMILSVSRPVSVRVVDVVVHLSVDQKFPITVVV